MGKWSLFLIISALILVITYVASNLAVTLGIMSMLLFAALFLSDLSDSRKPCGIPHCKEIAYARKVVRPNRFLYLCKGHSEKLMTASEYVKKGVSREFFTEERKRCMFNPTNEERKVMAYLVENRILENAVIAGKPSYNPTQRFLDLVIETKTILMLNGYVLDLGGLTEEGTKIAIKQLMTNARKEEVEMYSKLTCPFVYWKEMDLDMHRHRPKRAR